MCGIAGWLTPGGLEPTKAAETLSAMQRVLHHRGPDDAGQWTDAESGIALGFVRLAIIDLSPAGAQPMLSASSRYVLTFNGEIYNHRELRSRLESEGVAPTWRGHSDTETLLGAIEAWGLTRALLATTGMFAIALWDRAERTLSIARDRIGEKPLFYGWQGHGRGRAFLYASELKAMRCHPAFEGTVDRDALAQFVRYGYVVAPHSIHAGIGKLPPGCIARISARSEDIAIERYWSASEAASRGLADPLDLTDNEAVDALEALVRKSVGQQMLADVPLGAFLSGGIDSSTIVSLMQAQSSRPVKTFTIGFDEGRFNEAGHAAEVARHLGTDHHELILSPRDALAVIPRLPNIYDEPFADSSQIPTHLVAAMARRDVTVALSGDGGDELFAGYERYTLADRMWRAMRRIPRPVRRAAGLLAGAIPKGLLNRVGPRGRFSTFGGTVSRASRMMNARSAVEIAIRMSSRWQHEIVIGGREPESPYLHPPSIGGSDVETMMALDMAAYLPDDILAKIDRAAMAVSLETRVPLLDHEIVEFAWRLPLNMKYRNGKTKWVVREVLDRYVPRSLIERPKRGFSVPIDSWLRGPLREWASELLDERRLRDGGYIRPEPVRRAWQAHLSGQENLRGPLWSVLMFQAWLDAYNAKAPEACATARSDSRTAPPSP